MTTINNTSMDTLKITKTDMIKDEDTKTDMVKDEDIKTQTTKENNKFFEDLPKKWVSFCSSFFKSMFGR
jgi:hypothetical protein